MLAWSLLTEMFEESLSALIPFLACFIYFYMGEVCVNKSRPSRANGIYVIEFSFIYEPKYYGQIYVM